ncbi:MAG TPA: DUF542 domain-containing protein [Chryseosolibacter sp.]|nr:DUF542 domain-containing protein [Chryseosolibacter sp.]
MKVLKSECLSSIVTANLNAASVFNYYGIDFYSRGTRTLEHACIDENVPITNILEELWDLKSRRDTVPDFTHMSMSKLSSHILQTHHKFTEKKLVFIKHTIERLVGMHGEDFPNLPQIKKTFEDLSVYLTVHMRHEEFVVFPYIQKTLRNPSASRSMLRTIHGPINSMEKDHDHEVTLLKMLATLTSNFTPQPNADFAVKTTYSSMKELVEDLKIHIHLENNILFPKALNLIRVLEKNLN